MRKVQDHRLRRTPGMHRQSAAVTIVIMLHANNLLGCSTHNLNPTQQIHQYLTFTYQPCNSQPTMAPKRDSQSPPPKKGVAKVVKSKQNARDPRNRNTWTKEQLKAECKARGLKVGGNKPDLLTHLDVKEGLDAGSDSDGDEPEGAEEEDAVDAEKTPEVTTSETCLLYTSPSPRDGLLSRMPSSA